jgi:hypothetical protein
MGGWHLLPMQQQGAIHLLKTLLGMCGVFGVFEVFGWGVLRAVGGWHLVG